MADFPDFFPPWLMELFVADGSLPAALVDFPAEAAGAANTASRFDLSSADRSKKKKK